EFEALGLTSVSTFIASGNVVFEASGKAAPLELKIEAHLAEQLGYPVPTFVRAAPVVVTIAAREPFRAMVDGDTHLVGFLRVAPDIPCLVQWLLVARGVRRPAAQLVLARLRVPPEPPFLPRGRAQHRWPDLCRAPRRAGVATHLHGADGRVPGPGASGDRARA